jgi:hypothetical protein
MCDIARSRLDRDLGRQPTDGCTPLLPRVHAVGVRGLISRTTIFCGVLIFLGCGSDRPRVVTLGDSVSSTPTYRLSYVGLLETNADDLFPEFSKKTLASIFGEDVELVRLDRGGDSYRAIASGDAPLSLDAEAGGETAVIVALGANDLVNAFLRLLGREDLRADPTPIYEELTDDIRAVLAMTGDPALFPVKPRVYVMNAYDPSDGTGDVAAIASSILPPSFNIDVSVVTSTLALSVVAHFNSAVSAEAAAIGATLIDTHAHFLGHGYHFDEPAHPAYRAADPTRWVKGIFDPSLRGAHELRRLVWKTIAAEDITALPGPLPPDNVLGLPPVPANGWAKTLVDAEITQTLHSDETGLDWPNEDKDPMRVLGEPDLLDDGTCALGVLGAFVIVDLGEQTQALDGEGDDLVVLEQGTQSMGVPEPYRVSVATDAAGPFTPIADGRGERSFDLRTAGIARARYVKVESLATAGDVLGGIGSPLAPGPELDAIGAVHPGAP